MYFQHQRFVSKSSQIVVGCGGGVGAVVRGQPANPAADQDQVNRPAATRRSPDRRPVPAGPVERMERTSATRSGGTARHRSAKIEFLVFNLNERASHGQDYSGRPRFGKADNPSARD